MRCKRRRGVSLRFGSLRPHRGVTYNSKGGVFLYIGGVMVRNVI